MPNKSVRDERLLTSREVCEILSIKPRTLAGWVADKIIPSIKVGRRSRRFKEADIRHILETRAE